MSATGGAEPAGLARRLGASVYEALLLSALSIGIGFALLPIVTPATGRLSGNVPTPATGFAPHYLMTPGARALSATLLLGICAAYCIGLWSGGRRTLPMQTWRLALRTGAGATVAVPTAALRFLAGGVGPLLALTAHLAWPAGSGRWALSLLAVNYAWALFDRDRAFLQDRIAGTRLVAEATPRG